MNHGLGDILSRARRVAMMPVWAGQLLTGAKSFGDNPILGSRRLNALGLHAGRVSLAHRLAAWRRARVAHLVSPEDRAAFARDGFVIKPDFLAPDAFAALVAQVKAYRGTARASRSTVPSCSRFRRCARCGSCRRGVAWCAISAAPMPSRSSICKPSRATSTRAPSPIRSWRSTPTPSIRRSRPGYS